MSRQHRDAGANRPVNRESIGLPPRMFMFTIDQIAYMLNLTEHTVKTGYIFFEGRSTGPRRLDLMVAINIAPENQKPEWRVNERELVRWAKQKRLKFIEWGTILN